MNANNNIINKTMDVRDLESHRARVVITELNELIRDLNKRRLKISSWYGSFDLPATPNSAEQLNRGYGYTPLKDAADDRHFPWFLYWEIVWIVLNNEFAQHHRVLDLGGSSSLFSYYLASKGLDVTTVDLQKTLVDNGNFVGKQMNWKLENHVMDMRNLSFSSRFDHVTSVCVYEHVPMYDRVEINRDIQNLMVAGGKFSITFDYRNPSRLARINSPTDVNEQFVNPSGLVRRGNQDYVDTEKNYLLHPFYHPRYPWRHRLGDIRRGLFPLWELLNTKSANDYTFGALFLQKPVAS